MLLKSIQLTNFLSFGAESKPVELGPLNVIIGPNGSGKSNFIEALELMRAAPRDLFKPIREGGGVRDWLWKGASSGIPTAKLEVIVDYRPGEKMPLRYALDFTEVGQRFQIVDERVENHEAYPGERDTYFYYRFNRGNPSINVLNPDISDRSKVRSLQPEKINSDTSIFSQRKDSDHYPELTDLGEIFSNIRIYREWSFGRYTVPRLPQKADLPNNHLEPDASNLGLVLNRMQNEPDTKKRLLESLHALYPGIGDFHVMVEANSVQVFFHEEHNTIPATRLSDGTLRYLCLLAILCHPEPGPLVCIEEPELGLHPDVLSTLANLIREASERTQIIITTHSDMLVDAFTNMPEAVLVAERSDDGTHLERLNAEELKPWLEQYRLGELWTRGDIGGNRW